LGFSGSSISPTIAWGENMISANAVRSCWMIRIVPLLDRRVEGIHVDVDDLALAVRGPRLVVVLDSHVAGPAARPFRTRSGHLLTIFDEKIPYAPVLHVTMLFAPDKTGSGDMNKRGLQIAMALLGVIPVLTGIIGMFGLSDPLYASVGIPANAVLDSNLRFFGGVWLGLGLSLYLLIPNIEKQTFSFRVLWGHDFSGWNRPLGVDAFSRSAAATIHWVHSFGNHRCALLDLVAGPFAEMTPNCYAPREPPPDTSVLDPIRTSNDGP